MNTKKIILATTLFSVLATNLAVAVPTNSGRATASKAQIKETRSAFAVFKDDIKCFLNPKKTCTWEQRRRLFYRAIALIGLVTIGGFTIYSYVGGEKAQKALLDMLAAAPNVKFN